jgi:hypothetical protein
MTAPLAGKTCQRRGRVIGTNPLTSVRTSNTVFGDVNEAVRIEGHALDIPEGDVVLLSFLPSVSETQLARLV